MTEFLITAFFNIMIVCLILIVLAGTAAILKLFANARKEMDE